MSSLASLGAAAFSQLGLSCSDLSANPCGYEGIYTDRFTYRTSDTISVFVALMSGVPVTVSISRWDFSPVLTVATYPIQPMDLGNVYNPGVVGAGFGQVLQIPASDFQPGVYEINIPANAIQTQNQVNNTNSFPSNNSLAFFVVTPDVAGSTSRILWLHDSLTGVAYGSFAGASIYPGSAGLLRTVSWSRPGQDRAVYYLGGMLSLLRQNGYVLEYQDLVDLAAAPPGYLDVYNLVCIVGQFEYIPHEVMAQLQSYLDGGGNLFAATSEFATWRVRLDQNVDSLTTYKWDYAGYDPYYLSGDPSQAPYVAGIGMSSPASPYETEIIGQTVWCGNPAVNSLDLQDLPLYNLAEAGWILDGTGLGAGDAVPQAIDQFTTGLSLQFDASNQPFPILTSEMRVPQGIIVWGALPSFFAADWTQANGLNPSEWPALASGGYATATLQQRSSGAQVVSLPSYEMPQNGGPIVDQMLLNICARLSFRAT